MFLAGPVDAEKLIILLLSPDVVTLNYFRIFFFFNFSLITVSVLPPCSTEAYSERFQKSKMMQKSTILDVRRDSESASSEGSAKTI